MPIKTAHKQTNKKVERPKEPRDWDYTTHADGYKRIIRKHKPDEPPFSHSYVMGHVEADLQSAYHSLCHAVCEIKNSGLNKLDLEGRGIGHVKGLLRYALILGRHIKGDKDSSYFKEYVSKIDDIEDWNDMFPLRCVGTY